MLGFGKPKAFDFEKRLDELVAAARKAGTPSGEILGALSAHVVSLERQSLRAREARQYGDPICRSGNLP
jgi:hypothetical protein